MEDEELLDLVREVRSLAVRLENAWWLVPQGVRRDPEVDRFAIMAYRAPEIALPCMGPKGAIAACLIMIGATGVKRRLPTLASQTVRDTWTDERYRVWDEPALGKIASLCDAAARLATASQHLYGELMRRVPPDAVFPDTDDMLREMNVPVSA